jgi:hypothetical protein
VDQHRGARQEASIIALVDDGASFAGRTDLDLAAAAIIGQGAGSSYSFGLGRFPRVERTTTAAVQVDPPAGSRGKYEKESGRKHRLSYPVAPLTGVVLSLSLSIPSFLYSS